MATASKWIADGSTKESVWKYPRPPALEKTDKHLRVVWNNDGKEIVLADTRNAYRVLESELTRLQMYTLMLTHSLSISEPSADLLYPSRRLRSVTTSNERPTHFLRMERLSKLLRRWQCQVSHLDLSAAVVSLQGDQRLFVILCRTLAMLCGRRGSCRSAWRLLWR